MRKLLWEIASRTPGFRGKFRLCAALARPKGPPGTVVTRNGVRYRLWGHDLNEWYIATQNVHSDRVTACLDRLSSGVAAPVLWDIGANIGGVTLPFLQRNPSARAVCFEPSPEVAGRLLANLALNPALAKRCDVVLLPLTDRHGPTAFFVSSETFNSGVGGLGVSHNRAGSPVRTFGLTADEMLETGGLPPPHRHQTRCRGVRTRDTERPCRDPDPGEARGRLRAQPLPFQGARHRRSRCRREAARVVRLQRVSPRRRAESRLGRSIA